MRLLPTFHTTEAPLKRLQTAWKAFIDPVISLPLLQGTRLVGVELVAGSNQVAHRLQRLPQGYLVTRRRGAAVQVYDTGVSSEFITLVADVPGTVDLWVF